MKIRQYINKILIKSIWTHCNQTPGDGGGACQSWPVAGGYRATGNHREQTGAHNSVVVCRCHTVNTQ